MCTVPMRKTILSTRGMRRNTKRTSDEIRRLETRQGWAKGKINFYGSPPGNRPFCTHHDWFRCVLMSLHHIKLEPCEPSYLVISSAFRKICWSRICFSPQCPDYVASTKTVKFQFQAPYTINLGTSSRLMVLWFFIPIMRFNFHRIVSDQCR